MTGMTEPMRLVTDDRGAHLLFPPVPLWEGPQRRPGVHNAHPIALSAKPGAPISQASDPSVMDLVVQAYQSEDYGFMTAPPGASEWADALGDLSVRTVEAALGGRSPRRVLEVGGGSDYVARKLRERHAIESFVIVDPALRSTVEGVEVISGYFPHEQLGTRLFDLVVSFNCLEHVPDPAGFLRGLRARLVPDGLAVLIYPDCEAQLQRGDLNVLIHEHLTYFTTASSRAILTQSGFAIESIACHRDTTFVVLSPGGAPAGGEPVLDESGLLRQSAAAFQQVLTERTQAIAQRLALGQPVGFHGATNGLNVFLHLTGLGSHERIRIYDGDSSKHGKFLPACAAPILDPLDASYADNSLVVISAMSFFDSIAAFAAAQHGVESGRVLPLSAPEAVAAP